MSQQNKNSKKSVSPKLLVFALFTTWALSTLPPVVSYAQLAGGKMDGILSVQNYFTKVSVQGALDKGRVDRTRFYSPAAMKEFYQERGNESFWFENGRSINNAMSVVEILQESWTHGLNPENYHVHTLHEALNNSMLMDKSKIELLLTDAVVRYARDLSGMRIDPRSIKQSAEYWQQPVIAEDILAGLMQARDVEDYLQSFAPRGKLYTKLRKELVKLSKERGIYDHVLPLNFGGGLFEPGDKHKSVKDLRVRLGEKHNPQRGPENYYDDELASVVMKLQREHGLDPDGIIGPQTLNILNKSREVQIKQIIANLERMRWLDRNKPDRYILVNTASQTLWGIDDGRVKLEMPVIVGMPGRKTKSFKTEITGVRFNPDWTVPLSIKMKDFLPKLQEGGPDYLDYKGIEVIRGYGRDAVTLDPYSIDWDGMTWKEMGKLRMVQEPGDHNALGRIRVLMPNKYNIYLHDTNHPEYFEKHQRTLSSGCVRLSDPEAVARFVLNKNRGWSDRDMNEILSTVETTEVEATETMPVYIIYQSIWLDDKGQLVYGSDVYKRDKKLLEALSARNGYYIPEIGETEYASVKNNTELASKRYNQ